MKNTIYLLSLACLVASCGLSDAEKRLMEEVDGVYYEFVYITDTSGYYNHFMTYKLYIDGKCEMISATDSTDIKNTGTWTASLTEANEEQKLLDAKVPDEIRTIKMEWPNSTMIMTDYVAGLGGFGYGIYKMEGDERPGGYIERTREFFDKY